ncbi:hypothetical protein ABTM19_20575, partial [Acinetobacter baumannii]
DIKLAAQSPALGGEPAEIDSSAQLNAETKELRITSLKAGYHGQDIHLLSTAKLSFADGFAVDGVKLGAQEAVIEANGRILPDLDLT